ncbi:MAG: DUF4159 domain-containing protein [Gammaproteobacteria bacterium]
MKRPRWAIQLRWPAGMALLLLASVAWLAASEQPGPEPLPVRSEATTSGEFVFARLQYDSTGGPGKSHYNYDGRTWQRWETDFPQAEHNLLRRLGELTLIAPQVRAVSRRLTDADIFSFPFLYMCDPGYMQLSDEEMAQLRIYLENGGFLWIDDFWGDAEWTNVAAHMSDVLPGVAWHEMPLDHPILHSVFDVEQVPMIPGQDYAARGLDTDPPWAHRTPATGLKPSHLRGYFDDDGRLMVLATHNSDTGDGWEREAYGEWYFETYSTQAYMIGSNIIVYAMSH